MATTKLIAKFMPTVPGNQRHAVVLMYAGEDEYTVKMYNHGELDRTARVPDQDYAKALARCWVGE